MHWPTTTRNYVGISVARQKGLVSSKTFEKKMRLLFPEGYVHKWISFGISST